MRNKSKNGNNALFDLLEKTKNTIVNAADQNDDGELNLDDVTQLADSIGSVAKERAAQIGNNLELAKKEVGRQLFQPVFAEDLKTDDFRLSELIRIAEPDTIHILSKSCEGAIGYRVKKRM